MIQVQDVSKFFGKVQVLKKITFDILPGEIVGLLGHNGAGKTTLMRILTAFWMPSSGRVLMNNWDTRQDPVRIRAAIGYLPETPPLYETLTVQSYLKLAAVLHAVSARNIRREVDRALSECDLAALKHRVIGKLSKGMRQRVGLAQAIVHDPPILLLDEPTSGLDPLQVLQVRDLIKGFHRQRTVILSTHILSEIQQIADRILVIREGDLIVDQSLGDFLNRDGKPADLETRFIEVTKRYE